LTREANQCGRRVEFVSALAILDCNLNAVGGVKIGSSAFHFDGFGSTLLGVTAQSHYLIREIIGKIVQRERRSITHDVTRTRADTPERHHIDLAQSATCSFVSASWLSCSMTHVRRRPAHLFRA